MESRAWSEAYRTTTVCVDESQSGILRGRFYNRFLKEGKAFRCLTEFLHGMEQTLDSMDFPKSFTAQRTFAPIPVEDPQSPGSQIQKGQQATFAVRVLFRQNATWQGSVTWLEGRQEQSFRSALELIFLINSALGIQAAS